MPTLDSAHARIARAAAASLIVLASFLAPRVEASPDAVEDPPLASLPHATAPVDTTRDVLHQWMGISGNLRAIITTPAQAFGLPVLRAFAQFLPQDARGVFDLGLKAPDGEPMRLLALMPFQDKDGIRIGPYRIGRWPQERGRRSRYEAPQGFIEVTPENLDTPVSKRFTLADFVTHDQRDVWPKYLVLQPALLDKLELIGEELQTLGLPSQIRIMSGFRTPEYNASIRRRTHTHRKGPARDSRHMYGDAADIVVDADGDGRMDDLDGDGRVTVRDAVRLREIVERVEQEHPDLVGGIGTYRASRTHGPFVHVDTRGFSARW